ncbi:AbrB/MazE/SpoVT family DNA-binding domain-containing protein [Clostridium sp. FAM 1755]|uniref:AbrB/MazE/SpoVT family DNA-binding domain-containing protein n=2 Tax=Clostridium TaxID=1485 RepID=A0A6M0SYV5_CLOBO|nr:MULTISPECIES: AbrB/MazE/SpoVT family DNA-binding domain-containing protein [Clostridium]EJP6471564.1 AbrB/MazE/SpoVT family DNA-binding domain-containing protein [Clostridium botulinum]KOR25501.1 AbrB family transcriptional regulator [Clostridium sp. L74]MDS1003479.1 AbrB/MazE/SpoVT family DNA-binding domain-containing protein [Clostridium sporogenes]NFA60444.1 AbrB/MazE/SpoVT family DNA-binding domain-containing protein [Clostridium botulinum]NFI72263.1 AbrB/MazE/SpoVT family DNA-binding d
MSKIKDGKYIFGTVKVGERGQIVIPKEARKKFNINSGDNLIVLGDEKKGIAIAKVDIMKSFAIKFLEEFGMDEDDLKSDEE